MLAAPDRPGVKTSKRVFFADLPASVQQVWRDFENRHRLLENIPTVPEVSSSNSEKNRFKAVLKTALEKGRPRYSPTTLTQYGGVWMRLAHLALNDGVIIKDVGDVLSFDRCTHLLDQIETDQKARASANGNDHTEKNTSLLTKTAAMIALARAADSDQELIESLKRVRWAVDPMVDQVVLDHDTRQPKCVYSKSRRRTGPRHQRVIDQFSGDAADAVKSAFFQLPERLIAPVLPKIRAGTFLSRTEQVDVIVALTCRILMECPMRRANLAGSLRISGDRQTLFLPTAKGRAARLHIPASETKTKLYDVVAEFSEETTALLKLFIEKIRPQLAKRVDASANNVWLFPGEESSPRSAWSFSTTLKARAEKVAGIKLNPHAFRHVVGLLVLEEDPSQLALVSTLLGHSSLRTTSDWYAEVPRQQAQQAYLKKLTSVAAKSALISARKRGASR
jgi:integrase